MIFLADPINGIYPELLDGFSIEQYNLADESTIRAWLRNEKGFGKLNHKLDRMLTFDCRW